MLIKDIVIVGGGTSGWMAAASLLKQIQHVHITLVDKQEADSIGVGEATILDFAPFIWHQCGFTDECFEYCDGVKKSGISFPGWGPDGKEVWHPFFFNWLIEDPNYSPLLLDGWSRLQDQLDIRDTMLGYEPESRHGYHIDCSKLVQYIKSKIEDKITYIQSTVAGIDRDDKGIKSLLLDKGDIIKGDLFVDCTGFKSLLKENHDRVDLTKRLYVDTAAVCPVPYKDKDSELHTYTIAESVDDGWVWKTPLQSRIGSGLVFNRSVTDPEKAKKAYCEYWDHRITVDQVKIIDWTPYYDINQWDQNVVSIGLSAGFLEPLESTGVALICQGCIELIENLRARCYNKDNVDSFNVRMRQLYESSIDFVNMHYSKSYKDTPFWNYVRENYVGSERLGLYEYNLNSQEPSIPAEPGNFIGGANWLHLLVQFGYPMQSKDFVYEEHLNGLKALVEHNQLHKGESS